MNEQHEEAAKALELAKKALDQGIYDKAVRLFEKSLRMRKTAEAESFLLAAQKGLARQQNGASSSTAGSPSPSVTPSTSQPTQRAFTKEQEEGCRRILLCKTHYEALAIERTSSQDEIKKAYRKLALRFHPDKCGAPKAEEAFKKLSKAFEVLSDENERAHYDRYGDADPNQVNAGRGGGGGGFHHHHGNPFQGQEMDMDDLLRFFMQGGMGGPRVHHFGGRPQQQRRHDRDDGPQGISFQQLIFFLVSMFFMFSSFGSTANQSPAAPASNNLYSLFPNQQFNVMRKTTMNGVVSEIPYYVEPRFANSIGKSPRDLYYIETAVESSLHHMLKEKCNEDKKKYRRADTDACNKQREFEHKKNKRG